MTETLSLISVVVMALLLALEMYVHRRTRMSRDAWRDMYKAASDQLDTLHNAYTRLTDRDEKGRFVNREKGRAL